jgi:L-2-hydroxyglutarate oxidase LhgO
MAEHVQTVVIGAGVVGLAIARALAMSGREVLVLEREPAFGTITSARNSEVIHAGIYYPKDSLKARLCVAGRHALYDYCAAHGIPHRRCGKLIVACSPEEVPELAAIAARARANGVDDLREITAGEARAMEPALACCGALVSPSTGIVDSHALMLTLLGEAEGHGAMLVPNTEIIALQALSIGADARDDPKPSPCEGKERGGSSRPQGRGYLIRTGGAEPMELVADELVNSAGLGAPALARAMRGLPDAAVPRQWIAKGNYFSLSGRAPFSRLVYPAPVAGGLGVHLTLDLAGRGRFGPDVQWIEEEDYSVDPSRAALFYQAIRRYWPGLPDGALAPDYAGIRPKLAPTGNPDFRIDGREVHGLRGHVGLYGIESPGLTSSLAIGDMVRSMLDADR